MVIHLLTLAARLLLLNKPLGEEGVSWGGELLEGHPQRVPHRVPPGPSHHSCVLPERLHEINKSAKSYPFSNEQEEEGGLSSGALQRGRQGRVWGGEQVEGLSAGLSDGLRSSRQNAKDPRQACCREGRLSSGRHRVDSSLPIAALMLRLIWVSQLSASEHASDTCIFVLWVLRALFPELSRQNSISHICLHTVGLQHVAPGTKLQCMGWKPFAFGPLGGDLPC